MNAGKTQKTLFGSVAACNRVGTGTISRRSPHAAQIQTKHATERGGGGGECPDPDSTQVSTHLNPESHSRFHANNVIIETSTCLNHLLEAVLISI